MRLCVMVLLLPGKCTGGAVVVSQQLQVKHVDHPIIVQVGCRRRIRVVAHADRHRIKLIDHVVAVVDGVDEKLARRGVWSGVCHCDCSSDVAVVAVHLFAFAD